MNKPTPLSNPVLGTPEPFDHEQWLKQIRDKIERRKYKSVTRLERRKILKEARLLNRKPPKVRRMRCNWVRRALKKKHRLAGLPPPTNEEILAEKKRQPNYGKPMFNITKEHREKQLGMLNEAARDYYERTLAEMDCFGEPYLSQHQKALEKALGWQKQQKSLPPI